VGYRAAVLRIAPAADADVPALADLLIAVVAGGGSVGFLHPVPPDRARAYWDAALADPGRAVLVAWDGALLAGTVTLVHGLPPNQPHRGEIAKMMTHPGHRRRGVAAALLREAERRAAASGRWLLVLDTAVIDGAGAFYASHGWTRCGTIPDYALTPHGALTGTDVYWKRLG
jgi:GNAT superfamily N-acetyltransferase